MSAPTPLTAAVQHARALHDRGDLAAAVATLANALDAAAPALGADHPDVLALARLLASLHREAGDLASARRTLEEALAAGQRIHGEDDPLLLAIAFDLGQVADEFGNRHEARRNFSAVARLGPAVFGAGDPRIRVAVAYLGDDPHAPPSPAQPPSHTPTQPPPTPAHLPQTTAQPPPHTPTQPPTTNYVPPQTRGRHEAAPRQPLARRPRRRSTPMVVAMVAAVTVVAVLVVATVVLRSPTVPPAQPPPTTTSPSPSSLPAPTSVRLVDDGTSITVIWQDPTSGALPFIVSGARAGEQARAFATLPAGRTSYTVSGLNPRLQYCFTVAAVHSTDLFALSELVCTRRASTAPTGNPQPTATR